MIQITLTFSSMDAARRALLEIPESALTGAVPVQEVVEQPAKKPAPARATTAETATAPAPTPSTAEAAPVAAPEPKAETSAPAQAAEPTPAAIEYPTLQKAVFALAGKSRDAAAAVAASFGVKTFKELDSSRWAEALAAVQAKTAELG